MNGGQSRKIISGKGKEWSKESAAVMDLFTQWLTMSGLKRKEFLNRADGGNFKICFHRADDVANIILEDDDGIIGEPFVWWKESGIAFENYMMDVGFLFLHIGSLCRSETTKKEINDFVIANVLR